MRFLIWGAGGIGCYYGARLQTAGHQVTYVARGEHLKALQQRGLQVMHSQFSFESTVDAIDQDSLLNGRSCDDFDLIILTLKCSATAEILATAREWLLAGKTPVLSLQNGVDNESRVAELLGEERTLGGLAVRIGGHILRPGYIQARGPAQVVMGHWPQAFQFTDSGFLECLQYSFGEAGIPTRISPDIQRELWRKLLINNGVNPLSALTGLDTQKLTHHSVFGDIVYKMMEEVKVAAPAFGVQLEQSDVEEMFQLISEFDAIKTSMLVDREKGRPLELEGIASVVIDGCRQEGHRAFWTEFVVALLEGEYDQTLAN